MPLEIIDTVSLPGGACNDDRAGAQGALAWVLDGATDVLERRILPGASDASWLAQAYDRALAEAAATVDRPSAQAVAQIVEAARRTVETAFHAAALRPAIDRHEHPSAAGLIVHVRDGGLDYHSVADCVLLLERPDGSRERIGVEEAHAGDRRFLDRLRARSPAGAAIDWTTVRAANADLFRRGRNLLNVPDGYGALSITPTPERFVRNGRLAAPPGSHLLLATDGFTRLADVLCLYRFDDLIPAARRLGLAALANELRKAERDDATCTRHPRLKVHDDATALLARIV